MARPGTSMRREITSILLAVLYLLLSSHVGANQDATPTDFLAMGDSALASDETEAAIGYYEKGVSSLSVDDSLVVRLSLFTNLGSALSSAGRNFEAVDAYRNAILSHSDAIDEIVEKSTNKDATEIASQASFYLGMCHQELGNPQKAANAYAFASTLDEWHWGSLANLGAVLHDELGQPAEALVAYNKAFEILTQTEVEPTDPPQEPRYILSQLQYRIGLAITADPKRRCAMQDDPTTEVSCKELAANAFSHALRYDPDNNNARHMLAAVTADATMAKASNDYVSALFDNYAENFEHSLVSELGYNGYERLRRGFDRAFGGADRVPTFSVVVDAGCGTGLVGEQFRNISDHLVGIDLSHSIIEQSKKARPNLYDELKVGDVVEMFQELKPISLIIAGDSYIYFGDLLPLFTSMKEGLGDGGIVAFTLENVSEEFETSLHESTPEWRWQLTPSGRFAHRKEYVEKVGEQCHLTLIHYEKLDNFRHEHGVGVRGHLFIFKKINKEL